MSTLETYAGMPVIPEVPGDGLETTAEERAKWLAAITTGASGYPFSLDIQRLLRDIDCLAAALAEAKADNSMFHSAGFRAGVLVTEDAAMAAQLTSVGEGSSIVVLQAEIGRLQSILHNRVLGDQHVSVSGPGSLP